MTETVVDNFDPAYDKLSLSSSVFKRLQLIYIIANLFAAVANHLPGAYRYAIYESYGVSRSTIELFYIGYYASSLFIGTFVAGLADKIGRRLGCILFGIFYILYCLSFHFHSLWILAIGTVPWGIANALDQTAIEAWLITEHRLLSLDALSLKYVLRNTFLAKILVSIVLAFLSQLLVHSFGYIAPFDVAIGSLVIMIIFISFSWSENYGNKQTSSITLFTSGATLFRGDSRIILLGLCTSFFEAAGCIYGIQWTPALEDAKSMIIYNPIPLGFCFGLQLFSRFIGTIAFTPIAERFRAESFMIIIFLLSAIGLSAPIFLPNAQWLILIGFCLYEFCMGVYRPSSGLLRSEYIPDEIRSTVMNYMRVPQLLLIIAVLLSHFRLTIMFIIVVTMLLLATLCMIILRCLETPDKEGSDELQQVVLDCSSSFRFETIQSQVDSVSLLANVDDVSS